MSGWTVVMVSYRTGPVLMHAVARALAQEGLARLVVVDNGNPPDVLAELYDWQARDARLMVLSGHGNAGFARGCNLGALQAEGTFLLLLNPDCLLPEGALAGFEKALDGAMLAGPLLLNPDGSEQRGGRRELLTPKSAFLESFLRRGLNRHREACPAHTHAVPAISGACMALRLADYQRLGGMDEGYFLHVEDMDFCLRVRRAGGVTVCAPEVRVVHWQGTSDAPSCFIERCKARGFIRYMQKHYSCGWPMRVAIWARCAAKCVLHALLGARVNVAGLQTLQFLHAAAQPSPALPFARAIVTGATSHIGSFLLGRLAAGGVRTVAYSRNKQRPVIAEAVEWMNADITQAAFPAADIVFHCAPLWTLPPAMPALAAAGVRRVVAFGSTSMFTKEHSSDAQEREVAARLKAAEAALAASGMDYTILRPTLIYGSGHDGTVSRMARTLLRWRCFPVCPPALGLRQPVHADDLALAALTATPGAYNVSGGEALSYADMVRRVARALCVRAWLTPLPFLPLALDLLGRILHKSGVNGDMARRMNQDLYFSHEAAARDFGYAPRAFLSGGAGDIMGLPS